ncbi:zinc finger protein 62 homolog [Culex pipiens pallens]|uniref:zinc finger protein 62 homolog n=1 Tax=Culex pipiens pallens TaxID=42434 RepID=UPI0019532D31|nr:zinc finger protein 62 homolog [Culex pipiens pallens]
MEADNSGSELFEKVNETLEINESKADFNQEPEDDDFLPPEPKPPKKHPLQCEVCDKILTTKQSLKLHALTHVDPANRKTFRCEICETTFKSQPGLNYHLETKHNPDFERKKLPCPTCGRNFKSSEGRKIHMTIQHGAGGPIFKCKECPMVFARRPHLDLHMATHGAGQHVCTICGKSYARLKDLSLHEATCGVKDLCCAVCGKQFRKEKALENHRKKCRQECRNFRCLTCGQGFATEQALKTHEAVHRRTFRCSECSQTFVTVLALRNHEQTKHWEPNGFEAGVGEKRGRPRKSGSGGGDGKVRMRRSKYDLFIGLEHLADPSTLIEEEKPVKDELKPADLDPKRFPCEHCPLKFATSQALQNHAQRRHWEVLGLAAPAPEKRGRKRTRPLVRVSKKRPLEPVSRKRVRRPRKLVNYVELMDLPEMVECDAVKEEDGPMKSELVENVVIPANVAYAEEKSAPIEQVEESDIFATNEVIIKEEIVGFEDYEFDYFENDSAGGDEPVDELTFENIVADLELACEPTNDEVDTLAVEPELENNVSEQPHIFKELVIRLEKLDYSALVESSNGKKHFNRKECEHCGKAFVRQYDLAKHRVREHGSTETPTRTKPPPKMTLPPSYRCEECEKSYQFEHYLKAHNEKVHGITEEPGDGANIRTCKHCGQKLKSWPSLVKHLKFFHAESVDESQFVKCPSCPAKFLNQEDLDGHVCTKRDVCEREPRERSFKCDLCRKTYSFLLHLEAHYSVHPEYQNFKCDHCSNGFYNERELNKHKKNAHEPKPAVTKIRPFKSKYKNPFPRTECEQCGQTFAYRYRLALHRVKEHGSTEIPVANRPAASATLPRNFPCDQCDKSYHLQTNLTIHKAKVHGDGEAPPKYHPTKILKHTCKHCKKQFTAWGALIYHRKYIHGESIEKTQFVQCPSCRLKFATDEEMAEHLCLKGVIRPRERPFKCNLCDKSYFAKPHLEGHYSVHSEYHNFKCDQCSKGFFAESELVSHKKKAHIAKELYYACETCNQLFKSQQNLKRHRELHMGREYCCEHCGKKFKMRTNLKSHVFHVHAEYASEAARAAQAIPCTVCGKTLRGTSAFKQHMRTHNNDRRYKCSFPSCGKTFIASGSLKVHVQSHTKDYKYKCKFCEYGTVFRKRIVLHEQREHNHNRFAGVNDSQ